MSANLRGHRVLTFCAAVAGLLISNLVLWKFRIIDTASKAGLKGSVSDLYNEHYPMMEFGFESLASGRLPLWNPYQLMGTPFLAVPNVGLFYPPNWLYVFMDTGIATEVSLIVHLSWAGLGMFLLGRRLGLSTLGAIAAVVTFMWAAWMAHQVHQPSLIIGKSWLPITLFAVEGSLRGSGRASLGLITAVALQLFNGAPDYFVQNMSVAGGYGLIRLGSMLSQGDWRLAVRRGGVLLGSVVFGALLAAPQLLPSVELASESVRSYAFTLAESMKMGVLGTYEFLGNALVGAENVSVGLLPLAGMALGFATRLRLLWAYLLFLIVLSVAMVLGSEIYELFFETPLGSFTRRPVKFLHVYDFAQALMAGLAVLFLEGALNRDRKELLKMPAFLLCLGILAASLAWLTSVDWFSVYLVGLILGLLAFVTLRSPRLRVLVIVALVGMQTWNLFWGIETTALRPAARPGRLHAHDALLADLREMAGPQRVHISPDRNLGVGLLRKTGVLAEMKVMGDYAALAPLRGQRFFQRATGLGPGRFNGRVRVGQDTIWPMLDLTSTRYYVASRRSPDGKWLLRLSQNPETTGVRRLYRENSSPMVFERESALPRAYFVPEGRFMTGPWDAIRILAGPFFDPRAEVLLEDERFRGPAGPSAKPGTASVEISEDGRERVVLKVESTQPGFVVLNDSYYPGWEARIGDRATDLYRANYLFRAVRVAAGTSVITMEFRPASFRAGLWIGGGTLTLLIGSVLARYYLRRRPERAEQHESQPAET